MTCLKLRTIKKYAAKFNSYDVSLKPVESMSVSELVDEFESNNNRLKAVEARTAQLKFHILSLEELLKINKKSY